MYKASGGFKNSLRRCEAPIGRHERRELLTNKRGYTAEIQRQKKVRLRAGTGDEISQKETRMKSIKEELPEESGLIRARTPPRPQLPMLT